MDNIERKTIMKAGETLPAGFHFIRRGRTLPGDMVYSWPTNEWIRADSPDWLQPTPEFVGQCVAVARAGVEVRPVARRQDLATPGSASGSMAPDPASDRQPSLF